MQKINMNNCCKLYLISILVFFSFFFSGVSFAGIDLPWYTTYNCPEWTQADWSPVGCDNLSVYGGWTTASGHEEQITTLANNPDGGAGRGQRSWYGPGTNNNSGTLGVEFNTPTPEFWIRLYMKYPLGFSYQNGAPHYDKILYVDTGRPQFIVPEFYGSEIGVGIGSGGNIFTTGSKGWPGIMGGATGDGQWHCYEWHIKSDTNNTDGVIQTWVDGILVLDRHDIDFYGTNQLWHDIHFPSNQNYVTNSQDMPIDIDDISISNRNYIGPLSGGSGGDTTPPTVNVTNPAPGKTLSGFVTIAANAQDNDSITNVQFQIDGQNSGTAVSQAPFQDNLDTFNLADGSHSVRAIAMDFSGNQTTSSAISFTVDNSGGGSSGAEVSLFTESFEDGNLSARGWYDNTTLTLSGTEYAPVNGSTKSAEFHFAQGATSPGGGSIRRKFTASEDITIEFWVKYSSNWLGSGKAYHPHEIYVYSDMDSDYAALADNYLQLYIEEGALTPRLAIQDSLNVNSTNGTLPNDLAGTTENRSVVACNSLVPLATINTCYNSGGWYSASSFDYSSAAITAGIWHKVTVRFKLNSISGGVGQSDGIMQYWLDDVLLIDHQSILYRTGYHSNLKLSHFVIAPYIGDGSPIDQTMWIDNLTVSVSAPTAFLQPPPEFRMLP